MILVESRGRVLLGGMGQMLEEDRELAWAEKHVIPRNRGLAWMLGNFVQANQPNQNGHIFDLEELRAAQETIRHTPMNMLHRPHYIIGNYVASELLYPKGQGENAAEDTPIVEALAAMYRYYYPEEYKTLKAAHAEGQLFFSMECVPEKVRCTAGCGREFAYAGRVSETYCAHLNRTGAHKLLIAPTFTGGAAIVPPVRPGWRKADIHELSSLLEERSMEVEMAYDQISGEFPHLGPAQWESMMASFLHNGYASVEGEWARDFSMAERKKLAASGAALPDGSFPIVTPEDLANAIQAIGRAANPDKAKAHIRKRAKALGKTNLIPDSWNS